jgi:hypothetical protein
MHKFLVFIGVLRSTMWFGGLWGKTGSVSCGIIGLVISYSLVTGMDNMLPLIKALPRWFFLIVGTMWLGSILGNGMSCFGNSESSSAVIPSAICGAIVGLILCGGIPASYDL